VSGGDDSLEAGAGWAHGGINADGLRIFTQDVGGTVATLLVVSVEPTGNYRLRLLFDDGLEGERDIAAMVPFEGVFAPLRDPKAFGAADVDPVLGTIVWPNGADLDPDVLYAIVTGKPVPDLIPATICLDPPP
jgi:hypothetical protein